MGWAVITTLPVWYIAEGNFTYIFDGTPIYIAERISLMHMVKLQFNNLYLHVVGETPVYAHARAQPLLRIVIFGLMLSILYIICAGRYSICICLCWKQNLWCNWVVYLSGIRHPSLCLWKQPCYMMFLFCIKNWLI